jgi:hypothetical protein
VYTETVCTVSPPHKYPKTQLRELLDQYRGEAWHGKLLLMSQLRDYVRRQDPFIVRDEIRTIDNEQDLDVLAGVGMKGILYYEVIMQKARCIGQ